MPREVSQSVSAAINQKLTQSIPSGGVYSVYLLFQMRASFPEGRLKPDELFSFYLMIFSIFQSSDAKALKPEVRKCFIDRQRPPSTVTDRTLASKLARTCRFTPVTPASSLLYHLNNQTYASLDVCRPSLCVLTHLISVASFFLKHSEVKLFLLRIKKHGHVK